MPSLFSESSTTWLRLALLAPPVALLSGLTLLWLYVRTPWNTGQFAPVAQPVQFDHRHHVVDDQIDCVYCHAGAETTALAGVPATDVCMGCHVQIWQDSPLLETVRRSYFSGEPIAWQRVHRLPDFVYFNHSVHVRRGVGCASCHGRVDQMARVYQVAPLTMDWCLDCHRRAAAAAGLARATTRPEPLQGDERLVAALETGPTQRSVTQLTTCTACHR
jgi:cytochrome c7-like protein